MAMKMTERQCYIAVNYMENGYIGDDDCEWLHDIQQNINDFDSCHRNDCRLALEIHMSGPNDNLLKKNAT